MNSPFSIKIDNIALIVKKLNFKNYYRAFEIWKMNIIQFILVHNMNRNDNHAWSVDAYANVTQSHIDKIIAAIDLHYSGLIEPLTLVTRPTTARG